MLWMLLLVCTSVSVVVCAWVLSCGDSVKGNERTVLMGVKLSEFGDIGFHFGKADQGDLVEEGARALR